MPEIDRDDIQGLIARGYPNLHAASYVLLQIDDPAKARAWLATLDVTPGPARPDDVALNVAFTAHGLGQLGLPESAIGVFSNEFVAGMLTPHRRLSLGDTGPSAPETWLWGGPTTPTVDLLLILLARDEVVLADRTKSLALDGVSEIATLETEVDLDGREHFGFADGISQPTIDGLSSRRDVPSNTVAAGEVILGYPNEYGLYADRPLLEPSADAAHLLPSDEQGSGKADFGRNGCYLVFRQLSQDVRGFWQYVDRAVGGDAERRSWLAAKMVGRWPSGAPLLLAPEADDPSLASANDFLYYFSDPYGLHCPVGAHVRRAHPRDSLDPDPGTERSVSLDRRHRLLRRGREYGPPAVDPLSPPPPDEPDRGLYFLALVGNISRQFEFIQHTWLNNPKFAEHYDEPDPIAAAHPPGTTFSIPAEPIRERYHDLPRFVTTRGGAYFFLPGLRALRYLTSL